MQGLLRTNLYNDVLNLLEVWVHEVLYLRAVYPEHHFKERTAFQLVVHTAKTSLLSRYLQEFMRDLQLNDLSRISKYSVLPCRVELSIIDEHSHQPLEIHEFTLQPVEMPLAKETTRWAFQELDFKSFLVDTTDKLKRLPQSSRGKTFALDVLLRVDNSKQIANLAEQWSTSQSTTSSQLHDCTFLRSANIEITSSILLPQENKP